MRTLVISDLHLGAGSGVDVLRRPEVRATLFEALSDVDRLVLLGDVLELRHGPRRDALAGARPFFEDLGKRFAGREIVVVAGNHDHALVESWLGRRNEIATPEPLGLEQRFSAEEASSMLATLEAWAKPA
ncbi:MAG: metallophosphoesterase, partial [Solirubrobacteraceae bacterium]